MEHAELPLFTHWERTLKDLLCRTQKFPKAVRFTFTTRIDGLTLDVLEHIVAARWSAGRDKTAVLKAANLSIEKLRILLRITHDLEYLDHRGYEVVARNLDEAGRMIGGWLKQQAGK